MPRDKRKVEEALNKKGFERKEGDHHCVYQRWFVPLIKIVGE